MATVLVVDDDRHLLEAVCATLELAGISALGAADGGSALELLAARDIGLVITDVGMEPMDGFALLVEVRRRRPDLPIALMTAFGVVEQAVEAMRAGAADYLSKPVEAQALVTLARRLLTAPSAAAPAGFVAEDPRTIEVLNLAARVAKSSATVLLTGESGSGKEMFARYLHASSTRAAGPFIAINCAAIPESLLEATLFGHERGAFTGAAQSQPGKFEQSNGGTLLLDEISEMPLALQAKLLRVLQEREVERVGGRKPIPLDLRILATTNCDLQEMVGEGGFREDLFYRLNVFPLHIPPLRDRPRDILPLARHFAARIAAENNLRFSAEAEALLRSHAWPGNVRELENTVQRALILATGDVVVAADIVLSAATPRVQPLPIEAPVTDIKTRERDHILATLKDVGGSRKRAVQRLGISERTLRYKLQQYRLEGVI
jgi:two-component system, response regulator FlrC